MFCDTLVVPVQGELRFHKTEISNRKSRKFNLVVLFMRVLGDCCIWEGYIFDVLTSTLLAVGNAGCRWMGYGVPMEPEYVYCCLWYIVRYGISLPNILSEVPVLNVDRHPELPAPKASSAQPPQPPTTQRPPHTTTGGSDTVGYTLCTISTQIGRSKELERITVLAMVRA